MVPQPNLNYEMPKLPAGGKELNNGGIEGAAYVENFNIENATKLYQEAINNATKGPTATAGYIDVTTGKTYIRQSGRMDIPIEWHPEVGNSLVQTSLEALENNSYNILRDGTVGKPSLEVGQRIDNCAEPKALNDALFDGARKENLMEISINTRKLNLKDLCNNCQRTTEGIPFVNDLFPELENNFKK